MSDPELLVTNEESAVQVLLGMLRHCQDNNLIAVLARRLECTTATLYAWRNTTDEVKALQRLVAIGSVEDVRLAKVTNLARKTVTGRMVS